MSTIFCSLRGRGLEMVSDWFPKLPNFHPVSSVPTYLVVYNFHESDETQHHSPMGNNNATTGFLVLSCTSAYMGASAALVSLHDQHALPSPCLCTSFCRSHTEQVVLTVRFLSIRPMLVFKLRQSELAWQHTVPLEE